MTRHPVQTVQSEPSRAPRASRHTPSRRAPWTGAAAVSAAALLALATAGPAAAHDQLLSADPAAGTAAIETPGQLSLTFSGNLITGEGISNVATVTDENGHQWQDGQAQVTGPELSVSLCEGMPNGDYTVDYRVVYSDGHSEEKTYDFALEDPSAPEQGAPEDCGVVNPEAPASSDDSTDATTDASTGSSTDAATDSTTAEAGEAAAQDSQDSQDSSGALPGWVWAAGIGGVIVVVLAMLLVFRKAQRIDSGPGADQE